MSRSRSSFSSGLCSWHKTRSRTPRPHWVRTPNFPPGRCVPPTIAAEERLRAVNPELAIVALREALRAATRRARRRGDRADRRRGPRVPQRRRATAPRRPRARRVAPAREPRNAELRSRRHARRPPVRPAARRASREARVGRRLRARVLRRRARALGRRPGARRRRAVTPRGACVRVAPAPLLRGRDHARRRGLPRGPGAARGDRRAHPHGTCSRICSPGRELEPGPRLDAARAVGLSDGARRAW